jgi:hypothetical protein
MELTAMKNLFYLTLIFLFGCSTTGLDKVVYVDNEDALYRALEGGNGSHIIKLKKKTYHLRDPLVIDYQQDLTLDGNGATVILHSMIDDVIVINSSHRISIKDIKASHTAPKGAAGCTASVILINGGSDIVISNSELNGSGLVGVAAYGTDNLTISSNYIHNNSAYPIIYQGPRATILGNTFENNGNKNRIAFSYKSTDWPPQENIGSDTNMNGLVMERNNFSPNPLD